MISLTKNPKILKQIHLREILTQGISIIFGDEMSPYLVFLKKKFILCWHVMFQNFTT